MRAVAKIFIHNCIAYQTLNYKKDIYLGDPLNISQIYSDQGCQELLLIFKGKTSKEYLKNILSVITSPVAVSGFGFNNSNYEELISFGAEKIVLSDSALNNQFVLKDLSEKFGKQAVSLSVDYRFKKNTRWVVQGEGRLKFEMPLSDYLDSLNFENFGELILSNVDLDGSNKGVDYEVANESSLKSISMPVLLNCGFDGKDKSIESKKNIDGFISSKYFSLYEGAPLIDYRDKYAIF